MAKESNSEHEQERKEAPKESAKEENSRAEFEAKEQEGRDNAVRAGKEFARGLLQGVGREAVKAVWEAIKGETGS